MSERILFPDCWNKDVFLFLNFLSWKVLFVVPVFKNVRERSIAKVYRPVSLLSVKSCK